MMIILTAEQATQVRGEYENHYSLAPIRIDDDLYALPVSVLDNPNYNRAFPILSQCPIEKVIRPLEVEDELN